MYSKFKKELFANTNLFFYLLMLFPRLKLIIQDFTIFT